MPSGRIQGIIYRHLKKNDKNSGCRSRSFNLLPSNSVTEIDEKSPVCESPPSPDEDNESPMKSVPFVRSCFNVIFHASLDCLEKFADREHVFMYADTLDPASDYASGYRHRRSLV